MYKYKTTDGSERVVPGIGQTVNGVIETNQVIESPIFKLVEDEPKTPEAPAQPQNGVVGTAPNQSANAVSQATPAAPAAPSKTNEEQ